MGQSWTLRNKKGNRRAAKSLNENTYMKALIQQNLDSVVAAFVEELIKGKVFMKLSRNGRMFYRWANLDKDLTTFSMHIKGTIVE